MPTLLTDNPCVSLCKLDDDGVCLGCGRTKPEIKAWKTLPDEQRHDVNMRLLATGRKKVRKLLLKRLRQRVKAHKATRHHKA